MRVYAVTMTELLSIPLATASITMGWFAAVVDRGSLFFAIPMTALGVLWLGGLIMNLCSEHRHVPLADDLQDEATR